MADTIWSVKELHNIYLYCKILFMPFKILLITDFLCIYFTRVRITTTTKHTLNKTVLYCVKFD